MARAWLTSGFRFKSMTGKNEFNSMVYQRVTEVLESNVGTLVIQGIESFWATLKRAHKGTFHRLSAKHLHRYVDEFVSRHNMRDLDTLDQMALIAGKMENAQLRYKDLVASV